MLYSLSVVRVQIEMELGIYCWAYTSAHYVFDAKVIDETNYDYTPHGFPVICHRDISPVYG